MAAPPLTSSKAIHSARLPVSPVGGDCANPHGVWIFRLFDHLIPTRRPKPTSERRPRKDPHCGALWARGGALRPPLFILLLSNRQISGSSPPQMPVRGAGTPPPPLKPLSAALGGKSDPRHCRSRSCPPQVRQTDRKKLCEDCAHSQNYPASLSNSAHVTKVSVAPRTNVKPSSPQIIS